MGHDFVLRCLGCSHDVRIGPPYVNLGVVGFAFSRDWSDTQGRDTREHRVLFGGLKASVGRRDVCDQFRGVDHGLCSEIATVGLHACRSRKRRSLFIGRVVWGELPEWWLWRLRSVLREVLLCQQSFANLPSRPADDIANLKDALSAPYDEIHCMKLITSSAETSP